MAFNEKSFLSFIDFLDGSGRIHHFFYQLLRMHPTFITIRKSHTANQYTLWNANPDTRCEAGSDNTHIAFPD